MLATRRASALSMLQRIRRLVFLDGDAQRLDVVCDRSWCASNNLANLDLSLALLEKASNLLPHLCVDRTHDGNYIPACLHAANTLPTLVLNCRATLA